MVPLLLFSNNVPDDERNLVVKDIILSGGDQENKEARQTGDETIP